MKTDNTKTKILEAMYALISEKGYDKTSIGQIADMIGIKKASIYYYFASKEEILLALVQDLYKEDYAGKIREIKTKTTAAAYKEAIFTLGKDFVSSYFENQTLRKVYAEIDIQTSRIPALQNFAQQANLILKNFLFQSLSHGIQIGAFSNDFDVEKNAQMLYTILIGIDAAILYDLPVDPETVWKTSVSYLFVR